MSGDRTSSDYDIVATTRRSWSPQQKRAIVAEIDVDGASLSEVARRHRIHSSLLFRWRKTFGSATGPARPCPIASLPVAPAFVPVMLPPPSVPAIAPAKASVIEIVLDGRRTLRVGADVDTDALARIVDALEKTR